MAGKKNTSCEVVSDYSKVWGPEKLKFSSFSGICQCSTEQGVFPAFLPRPRLAVCEDMVNAAFTADCPSPVRLQSCSALTPGV